MWILPSSISSVYSLEAECLTRVSDWPSTQLASTVEWYVTLSGTATRRPASWHAWKRRPYFQLLSGALTFRSSEVARGGDVLTSSLRATRSRASRSAPPVESLARGILDTFGRQCVERLAKSVQASSSWKTLQATCDAERAECSGISKDLDSALRRDCLARRDAARATAESGCLSLAWKTPHGFQAGNGPDGNECAKQAKNWPTPNANPNAPNNSQVREAGRIAARTTNQCLGQVSRMWPTPKVSCSTYTRDQGENMGLLDSAKTWATPTTLGANGPFPKPTKGSRNLVNDIKTFPDTPRCETTGPLGLLLQVWTRPECPRLNPRFVEWLMGWPQGLTSCDLQETESTRWWQATRSALFSLLCCKENLPMNV